MGNSKNEGTRNLYSSILNKTEFEDEKQNDDLKA